MNGKVSAFDNNSRHLKNANMITFNIILFHFWFQKINRVNAIIAKFLTILKLQPNMATLRSDLTQAVR